VGVALIGSLFSAGAYVMVRRLRGEAPVVVVFYFALVSVMGSIPAAIPTFVVPRGWDWLLLASVGVSTHLGQLSLTRGLQQEAAGRAMSVGYVQIVFATLWGMTLFSDFPDRWTLSGALLIVLSTFALARTGPRVAPSATEPPRSARQDP
jgi:drug/metabolite transporter (DMT)-like permease